MDFLLQERKQCHVKVCRVCLNINTKIYDIRCSSLGANFEAVTGIPVLGYIELPPYLCYECAAYLKKWSVFKERCLKGHSILCDILQKSGKITTEELNNIDRIKLDLVSTLSKQCTETISSEYIISTSGEVIELQNVKEEQDISIDIPVFEDAANANIVKQEDTGVADILIPDLGITSDDEPLSVHKTKGERKKKHTKKKKRKLLKEEHKLYNIAYEEDIVPKADSYVPVTSLELEQSKRRRGRPRKAVVVVNRNIANPKRKRNALSDNFNLADYVTTVTLTVNEQIEEINKRKVSHNYINAPYKCNLCYKGFIDTKAWNHHLSKHDPSAGDLECLICRFRYPTKRALMKHATNHDRKYCCKSCSYVSKTTAQAKQHQKWHEGVTYACEYCDEISSKWTSHLSHVRMKHPSQHVCSVCGYSFVSELGLTMHRTMMHKDVETNAKEEQKSGLYCADCDVEFVSTEAYNRHMVTSVKHSEVNNFSKGCRLCGCTFNNADELRAHARVAHVRHRSKTLKKDDGTWPAPCPHCDEKIESARYYWAHFRRVHPDKVYPIQKNYMCDICGKSFRSNAFLTYHKRTHTEERGYKCDTCGKAFFNRSNLKLHMRTHSDFRPYSCSICCKAFKCKGALDRHFRCHTGAKPYHCEVCGKGFGQSNSRNLHVRSVHLKQPYNRRSRVDKKKAALVK